MPAGGASDRSGDDGRSGMSLWHRVLLALPRVKHEGERVPPAARLGERLRSAVLKPADPDSTSEGARAEGPRSAEELEQAIKYADDKERLVGLLAAPFAAIIGIIIHSDLISRDHIVAIRHGQLVYQTNPNYYHDVLLVLLALSVLMVVTAWFRKRLFLGVVLVLYAVTVFNLKHYIGFAIPYVLVAAWLLVRSFRLQRQLRETTAGGPGTRPARGTGNGGASRPGSNRRYTPPSNQPRRSSLRKPDGPDRKKRAG